MVRVLPEGGRADLSRVQGTDAAEVAVFEDRSTGRTIVVCALDNLGKGAAGQAVQNANLALGLAETAACACAGSSYERHRRAGDSRRAASTPGIRKSKLDLGDRPLRRARDRRRDVHRQPCPGGAGASSRASTSSSPSRRRSSSTRASRTPPPASAASSTRARPRRRRLGGSTSRRGGARPLHRRDRSCPAAAQRARRARRRRRVPLGGRGRRGGRGDHDHRHAPEAGRGRAAPASSSAGWRRAPG